MKYRIRDIENFVATARCTTIIQAAKMLEMGQPSLSESIKRLEDDCGKILFYRSRSGIQLTTEGKVFLSTAQKAIAALKELEAPDDKENVFGQREISIGCHPTVAQYTIPKALAELKRKAPDYKIELRHDLSRTIQAEIQRGRVDVGIVVNPAEVPDLVIRNLAKDQVAVWTSKTGSSDHDTIICNLNLFQTQSILKKWKNKPAKVISTDSLELIAQMVSENLGYGILPERAVKLSGLPLKKVTTLPSFEDQISLVHRPEFGKSLPEKLLVEALKNSLA